MSNFATSAIETVIKVTVTGQRFLGVGGLQSVEFTVIVYDCTFEE